MAKGRIGLDVGSTAVRAVELSAGGSPSVVRAAQVAPSPATRCRTGVRMNLLLLATQQPIEAFLLR